MTGLQVNNDTLLILTGVLVAVILIQLVVSVFVVGALSRAARQRATLNKEMFGMLRKIEGLTAHRREQMLKHYDEILADLSLKLPPTIASEAGQLIFEMESRILSRLAELESEVQDDEVSKRKMDDLIKSMETLEATIVTLTANTVQDVMAQGRKDLFRADIQKNISFAA